MQATSNPVTKQQLVLGGTNTGGSATQTVSLPSGTYTLGFDYKTQGTANHASAAVPGSGVSMAPVDLTAPQATFDGRTVTFTGNAGTATVAITAAVDNVAWSQLQVDNVTLWRN